MEKVYEVLRKNIIVSLATVNEEGNPRVRPFQVAAIKDGKIYFVTSNEKKVFDHVKNHQNVEITVSSKDRKTVRLSGDIVVLDDNKELKTELLGLNPNIKMRYGSADNPTMEVLCLGSGNAELVDLSNAPAPPLVERFKF